MKIVYSQWSLGKEPFKEMAACSNYLAQSHGYETILYTDEKGKENFKNIKFSEIRLFPDIIHDLPKKIWSLGKLLAMSQMDEPFFHMDQDFFLYKDILKNFWNEDFVVFYDEPFFYKKNDDFEKLLKIKPKELDESYKHICYNFAIVGGQSYKDLSKISSNIIEHCIKNKEMLENIKNISIIAEQAWISNLMLKKNIQASFLLKDVVSTDLVQSSILIHKKSKNIGVFHFINRLKIQYEYFIKKYAKILKLSY